MSNASPLTADRRLDTGDRETSWHLIQRLIPYAKENRRLLLISLAMLIPLAVGGAVQPILIGEAISLIRGESVAWFLQERSLQSGLNILIVLLMVTVLLQLSLSGFQGYYVQEVGQRMTASIRNDLFDHVTSLATRFFDRTPVGRLITRLTSDVDALGDVFSTGAIGIVGDFIYILALAIAMFVLQWQLALMLVLMLVPITACIVYFQQQYRRANYKAREELSALNSNLQENIAGINIVQLFRRERFNTELFREINQRYIHAVDRTILYDASVSGTLEWIALIAIAAVLWLGGLLVLQEALEIGTLASFVLFAQQLFNPLRQFAEKFTAIQAGLTAIERINDLLSEPIEIRDPEALKPEVQAQLADTEVALQSATLRDSLSAAATLPATLQPTAIAPSEIQFDHVWFGYKSDEYVIKDLNFTIRPGEKVAIVGPTGAGKSSIIRLLCRLYELSPGDGHIRLDGIDIRDLPQAELRTRMAVILQDGFLFAGDVNSNISLGETYTEAEIRSAAERTNIAPFIENLPEGYHTMLRARGVNLSGGQKQLLAFARAAIRNPSILVLDEATANLDVGTEALIQDALERLLEHRTAIIIAHRLSTIRNVDRILVLKQGQLVEMGSHEELLAKSGLYASLYRLQMLDR